MPKCEKCGYEFNYDDPSGTRSYYRIEMQNEVYRGRTSSVVYCKGCAPFGNTKIPAKLE